MNIVGIVFAAILVLCAIVGWRRGMTALLSGIISMVVSCLLVSALLPMVTELVRTQTPVYDMIENGCEQVIDTQMTALVSGITDSISTEEITAYGLSGTTLLNNLTKIEQTKLIKALPVPSVVQKTLLNYNNSAGYKSLGVSDFAGYLAGFIANEIINIISFCVCLIVVWIIVHMLIGMLNLLAHLPLIYEVNRVGGLICGILQGLFIVWGIMLVLSALSGTTIGAQLLTQADANVLLTPVFESNIFLRIATQTMTLV